MVSNQTGQPAKPDSDLDSLSLPGEASVLLASDMHLGEHDPASAQWFTTALQQLDGSYSHLILLGDLFEAWIGDDQTDPVALSFLKTLAQISAKRPVYVMRGNRDFLLNLPLPDSAGAASFSRQTGAQLLADPCRLTLGSRQWLLAHGDALCTDDLAYQAFRQESRQASWAATFLAQSLEQRSIIARQMRLESQTATSNKPENLTDVNPQSVQETLDKHGLTDLIHGHTHRPAHHHWAVAGVDYSRHVLSDWDGADQRGGFFRLDAAGLRDAAA